jgi:hypothetical protein
MSMAAGEYVSVHSQADTERADLQWRNKLLQFLRRWGAPKRTRAQTSILNIDKPRIATLPKQEQIDEFVRELAPDVVRIRLNVTRDWSDDPAIYFRVILSDEASQSDRLADVTGRVRAAIFDRLGLANLDHIPYFRFRSQSEQVKLQEKAWD